MKWRNAKSRIARHGLVSVCLAALLSGCASDCQVVKQVTIPPALTVPVPEPTLNGGTNDGLLEYCVKTREALRKCNGNLKAIRESEK